jgi:hypothetical protein
MPITLSLSSVDLDDETLQELTRQLCRDLGDEAGIAAELGAEPSEAGAKGDFELIGQILIKALGAGGAIAALVGVLKAYVQRKPSLQFEFQMKGGDKLKIKADDLRADDMTKLVQTIKKAVEGMND